VDSAQSDKNGDYVVWQLSKGAVPRRLSGVRDGEKEWGLAHRVAGKEEGGLRAPAVRLMARQRGGGSVAGNTRNRRRQTVSGGRRHGIEQSGWPVGPSHSAGF
jgi:hypothetical protein